jgi:glucose-1-phosphate cytidylyltransferase
MVEIGGKPILWHIMQHFGRHGFKNFMLALGHMGWVIDWYCSDPMAFPSNWKVYRGSTGYGTQNGGRLLRLKPMLEHRGTFLMSWCDGVTDLNLTDFLAFHREQGKLCTVAAVRPRGRFGELILTSNDVASFTEKPEHSGGWINGGFFACEPGVFDYIDGDQTQWEQDPMQRLAKDGQLAAYQHDGFWQCMDTERDWRELEAMWQSGKAAWKTWED